MKNLHKFLLCSLLVTIALTAGLQAQDRMRKGEMRGVFVKRVEKQVGEKQYLAIVVKPLDGDDHVTIIVPRENEERMAVARRLEEGQRIGLAFVVEHEQKWLTRLEAARSDAPERRRVTDREQPGDRPRTREGDPPVRRQAAAGDREVRRPVREGDVASQLRRSIGAQLEQLVSGYRRLMAQMERMEAELKNLRAENERLKRALRQMQTDRARPGEGDRENPERRERESRRDTDRPHDPEQRRESAEREGSRERDKAPERDR